jgi:hypothetical protein
MLRHTLLLQACIRARQAVKVGLQYAELPCFVRTYLQDALATQDASRLSRPLCKRRIHHSAAKTVPRNTCSSQSQAGNWSAQVAPVLLVGTHLECRPMARPLPVICMAR